MTKRDFFRLMTKLFGLYWIVMVIITIIPNSLSWLIVDLDFIALIWVTIVSSIVIALISLLIFKADKIIDWLKLDAGFDEDRLDMQNLTGLNIVKIALIIIGGILLLKNLPSFLTNSLYLIKNALQSNSSHASVFNGVTTDSVGWVIALINIVVGYFLIARNHGIANFLKNKIMRE